MKKLLLIILCSLNLIAKSNSNNCNILQSIDKYALISAQSILGIIYLIPPLIDFIVKAGYGAIKIPDYKIALIPAALKFISIKKLLEKQKGKINNLDKLIACLNIIYPLYFFFKNIEKDEDSYKISKPAFKLALIETISSFGTSIKLLQ